VLGREPSKQEIERVKGFLPKYAATWKGKQPGTLKASSSGEPQVVQASLSTGKNITAATPDATEGIVRSDSLGQDDPDDTSKQFADETQAQVVPESARDAAWGAFVQSLYGSAEFQFVR